MHWEWLALENTFNNDNDNDNWNNAETELITHVKSLL